MIQKLLFSLVIEKMDDNYIYFELNNRKLRMDKEDNENICYWYWTNGGGRKLKNPRWRKSKLSLGNKRYYNICISDKTFRHHRVVYYAWNQDWDIHHDPQNNPIDHEDENKQNNHISNLRLGTHSLNQQNRKSVKGYTFCKTSKKYRASIRIDGKRIHLGCYKKEEDARNAYLEGKKIYHKW